VKQFIKVIEEPDTVEDTKAFATVLGRLGKSVFVEPLVKSVSSVGEDKVAWLTDYLCALGMLLSRRDDFYEVGDEFAHLLGGWMLSANGERVQLISRCRI